MKKGALLLSSSASKQWPLGGTLLAQKSAKYTAMANTALAANHATDVPKDECSAQTIITSGSGSSAGHMEFASNADLAARPCKPQTPRYRREMIHTPKFTRRC